MKQTLFIVSRWDFSCEFTSKCWHAVCRHLYNRLEHPDCHRWKVGGDTFDSFPSPSNLSISFIPDKDSFTLWKLETSVVIQPELGIIKAWAARCEQMACRVRRVIPPLPIVCSNYQGCFLGLSREGEGRWVFWQAEHTLAIQGDSYNWQRAPNCKKHFWSPYL